MQQGVFLPLRLRLISSTHFRYMKAHMELRLIEDSSELSLDPSPGDEPPDEEEHGVRYIGVAFQEVQSEIDSTISIELAEILPSD